MRGFDSTQESENGTVELSVAFKPNGRFQINLDTESYTSTAQIIYCLKVSPGFHNPPSLECALVQLLDLALNYPGCKFSCRFTTRWCSKSLITDVIQEALRKLNRLFT